MAKTSSIERNLKREKLAVKYQAKRDKLKAVIADEKSSPADKFEAMIKLAALPRNGSKVRIHNRCALTGRSRGVYRKFGLNRIKIREMANNGELPGVVKSSW